MKNVLFLTLYPVKPARHGGQHRALNLMQMYEELGYEINHIFSVVEFDSETWMNLKCDYIKVPNEYITNNRYGKNIPEIYDYLSGEYFRCNADVKDKILQIIINKAIKIIHVEQPWQMALISDLKDEQDIIFKDILIVYGSQNVEYLLKSAVLDGIDKCEIILDDIKKCEIHASQKADIVLAVSKEEKVILESFGAKKVILAQNGISVKDVIKSDQNCFSNVLPKKYLVFIGSAHKPNSDGFMELVGPALGCIPMKQKIVIIGGVGDLIQQHQSFKKWIKLNEDKVVFLKNLTDSELQSVINRSSAVVLPILSGGGTNLKTAEAIFSGKQIIATSTSFRGFEKYIDDSITIADDKESFRSAIRCYDKYKIKQSNLNLNSLLWDACFKDFKEIIKGLK